MIVIFETARRMSFLKCHRDSLLIIQVVSFIHKSYAIYGLNQTTVVAKWFSDLRRTSI